MSLDKDVIICPLSKQGSASESLLCQQRRKSSHPEACVRLLFFGEIRPSALLGRLAARCPNTSWLLPRNCLHTLPPNLPPGTKGVLQPRDCRTCPAPRPVLGQDSSVCLYGVNRSWKPACSPRKQSFFKKSGRTCVYWQFINKHQPPCKLFAVECSEVEKCEYK